MFYTARARQSETQVFDCVVRSIDIRGISKEVKGRLRCGCKKGYTSSKHIHKKVHQSLTPNAVYANRKCFQKKVNAMSMSLTSAHAD